MRYRILAAGFIMSLGPLIGTATAMEPISDVVADNDNNVIADVFGSFFSSLQTACDLDITGTTTRRNVVAMKPASAGPSTLVATSTASKPVAPVERRYERRFAGLRFANRR